MKQVYSLLILSVFSLLSYGQQTIDATLMHDGAEREYILYIPASYNADTPVPLVFNFHGYGSNANEQMLYGDFRTIADTANFILVHPQGLELDGTTHWNVGGWTINSTVDDIGFTDAMIDSIAADYSINLERVYSTGMSNGGFMSYQLACQLSDRIAAIASVTGSMTPQIYDACNPQHPMPVLHIHGTSDQVVGYNGAWFTKSVSESLDYWVNYNVCEEEANVIDVPDTATNDGSTVEHYTFSPLNDYAPVEHFKVNGGDHTWPGTAITFPGTNYDINASDEIWRFFARYDINGEVTTTNISEIIESPTFEFFPNPATSNISILTNDSKPHAFEIVSSLGQIVLKGTCNSNYTEVDLSSLSPNIYFIKVAGQTKKFIKSK